MAFLTRELVVGAAENQRSDVAVRPADGGFEAIATAGINDVGAASRVDGNGQSRDKERGRTSGEFKERHIERMICDGLDNWTNHSGSSS